MKKRMLLALLLLLGALALCGCSKEPTEEEIFTKTIHDFGDLRVDNLDEQENTNFIVYAEGAQEITTGMEHNTVLSVDEENLCYTFQNPDAALLAMEPGDVFWAAATRENPEGVTVKLKSMEQQGDTLVVYSEEIGLADLFEYVDINMDVPMSEVWYDVSQVEEGSEIIVNYATTVQTDKLSADAESSPMLAVSAGGEGAPTLLGASSAKVERLDWGGEATATPTITLAHDLTISRGGALGITGSISNTLQRIWVKFRWSTEHAKLSTGLSVDVSMDHTLGLVVKVGKGFGDRWQIARIRVPIGGVFGVSLSPWIRCGVEGTIKGEAHMTGVVRKGFTADVSREGFACNGIDETLQPLETPSKLTDMSGKFNVGLEVMPAVDLALMGETYGSIFTGIEISGEEDPVEEREEQEKGDYRHECKLCIDGELSFVHSTTWGARVKPGAGLSLGGKQSKAWAEIESTVHEGKAKLKDFYISFFNENSAAEFGWDECPHKRWKTMVEVEQKNGGKADGASVTATTPDGEKISEVADEDGIAVLYLPNGENSLRGLRKGEKGRTTVEIKDKPAEKELVLDGVREIFVVGYTDTYGGDPIGGVFAEAENVLSQRYPEAVWIEANNWYNAPIYQAGQWYEPENLAKAYAVAAGDICIEVTVENTEYHVQYYGHPYNMEIPEDVSVTVYIALQYEGTEDIYWQQVAILGAGTRVSYSTLDLRMMPGGVDYFCEISKVKRIEYDDSFSNAEVDGGAESVVIDPIEELQIAADGMPIYEVLTEEPVAQRLAEWYIPYLYPYIDLLWNNAWEEDLVPIYPGDAA